MVNRQTPPITRPAPKVKVPEEKPKAPTNTYERVTFFSRRVYKQLTANRFRILVVGAFPFVAYICTSFIEYQRKRYEFRLQQSTFFKNSIAAIANSPEIRENYGKNIKLKRASFWTVSSGFVPWIKERHVWLGFSGNLHEGWIRMGLRRTDFVLNKDVFKALGKQIDNELGKVLKDSMELSNEKLPEGSTDSDVTNTGKEAGETASTSPDDADVTGKEAGETASTSPDDADAPADNGVLSGECSSSDAANGDEKGSITEEATPKSSISHDHKAENISADESTANEDVKPQELTAREIMEQKLIAKEIRDKSQSDASQEYLRKVRELYPQLSENFSQNDLEQAIALRKDRLLMGQAFDKTWDLLSLSIHPADSKATDIPVYVLYDPEESYVDQGDYVIDTSFLSIKRKEALQTEVVKREIPAQTIEGKRLIG